MVEIFDRLGCLLELRMPVMLELKLLEKLFLDTWEGVKDKVFKVLSIHVKDLTCL